jgi:type IV pilus assembly protein PilC
MPSFAYRAVHASGRVAKGRMAAANENELAHYLRESGMELIDARAAVERSLRLPVIIARNAPPRALAVFCTRLHDLLLSGIPFADALRDVADATDNKIMRDALTQIVRAIGNGGGIASSFALYPRLFSDVFIAIVTAGENSGDMAVIFDFLARYADNRAQTQERLRRAVRYPLFLFVVAGSAVSFMLSIVVPQVVQFLIGIQSDLPLATRMLLALSALFARYGAALAVGLTVMLLTVFLARHLFPGVAIMLDAALLRVPVVGNVMRKTALARFAHSFAILFHSGCDVPACLRQARATVGNRSLRDAIEIAERRVQSGAALSIALDSVMPPFAIGLLRTGERSGRLGKSLDDIATAYDREAQAATDTFIGMLEPCLTLTIGGLLAWTVVAVLGPLYGSLSVLGAKM